MATNGMERHREGPGIEVSPGAPRLGDRIHVAFRAAGPCADPGAPCYEVAVLDAHRHRVATLFLGRARAAGDVVSVDWDGSDDRGSKVPPGLYQLRVRGIGFPLLLERTLKLDN